MVKIVTRRSISNLGHGQTSLCCSNLCSAFFVVISDIESHDVRTYGYTTNSFIFSLRNNENLGPFKSMVIRPSLAIMRETVSGPTFGRGNDIHIANNANTNTNSYTDFGEWRLYAVPSEVRNQYTVLAGSEHFTPDDWEVFYLAWVILASLKRKICYNICVMISLYRFKRLTILGCTRLICIYQGIFFRASKWSSW